MKTLFLFTLMSFAIANAEPAPMTVKVTDAEAVLLFRYVAGAGVPLREDTKNQILHVDVMMCSIYFNMPPIRRGRCLLPAEQVRVENENAVEVTNILQTYKMPVNFQLGYETRQAGLDCTYDIAGNEYPQCYLTPKP
jgi:hypothetical protein